MERSYEELRDYTAGLRTAILKLRSTPITDQKAIAELSNKMILLTDYLGDVIDSTESEFRQMSGQLQTMEADVQSHSHRSLAMIQDIKTLNQKVAELDEVKGQVEKLTNIILRSLKDLPVKGADEEAPLTTIKGRPWSKDITVNRNHNSDVAIEVPGGFSGTVMLNGVLLTPGDDYKYIGSKDTKDLVIKGPIYKDDNIRIEGRVTKGTDYAEL